MPMFLMLSLGLLVGCKDKGQGGDDGDLDGGAEDGGSEDGGSSDGGGDGGSGDGGSEGEPSLVFELAADTTVAGEAVAYELHLLWPDGSEEPVTGGFASDLEPYIVWDLETLTPTVAGEHTLTALYEDLSAEATLLVQAGPAATLELVVDPTEGLDPGDAAEATVAAWDAYGNPAEGTATLSVDPATVEIDGSAITFLVDGAYTVRAEQDSAWAEVGPILVDGSGPVLTLTSPARGTHTQDAAVTVSGTVQDAVSGVTSLVVDGEPVTVGSDGSFSVEIAVADELHLLETVATDGDGNTTLDLRAVLAADAVAAGESLDSGLVVRLNDGDGGLDALADELVGAMDEARLLAMLPEPLLSAWDEVCYYGYCIDYGLDVVATDLRYGSMSVDLVPSEGELAIVLEMTGFEMDWDAEGESFGTTFTGSGTMTADLVTIEVPLMLSVTADGFQVEPGAVVVDIEGLDSGAGSTVEYVLASVGVDLESIAEEELTSALEEQARDELAPQVEEALASLQLDQSLEAEGATVHLSGVVTDLAVDEGGLTLVMGTSVQPETWAIDHLSPGSADFHVVLDELPGDAGAELAASLDLLGQLAWGVWGGGALAFSAPAEELGLDSTTLALLLPGLTDPTLEVDPFLPPIFRPNAAGDGLELLLGDLRIRLLDGSDAEAEVGYDMYAAATLPIELVLGDGLVTPTLGEAEVRVDVVTAPEGVDPTAAETALEALLPWILDDIEGLLIDVPFPEIEGLELTDPTLSLDEVGADYVIVAGDLSAG